MRLFNRLRLLGSYRRRRDRLRALPVEYIVETTAKCNLYCPMCPRASLPQPKQDLPEELFDRLIAEAAATAEHMMLIGLGEPLLDPKIYDRIEQCARQGISTLLSTNGVLLDEAATDRLLRSSLEQLTLSTDGARKETFEFYRQGARFEQVRDNFVRFCHAKHERRSRLQVVVQLVRLAANAAEVEEFVRFWRAVPGVDQVRIKEDETNLMQPQASHDPRDWQHPCHYLWRGPLYVKYNGDVYPCCQSYLLGGRSVGRIGAQPLAEIWNSEEVRRMRRLHALRRSGEIDICARCLITIPHPLLVAGSLLLDGRTVRRALPVIERLALRRPGRWLQPPQKKA